MSSLATLSPLPLSSDDSALQRQSRSSLMPAMDSEAAVTDAAEFFGLAEIVAFVRVHRADRVCLQFPDSLLPHAADLSARLARECGCQCLVLADTAQSPCCVDTVAAHHCGASAIVHFGVACSADTGGRLPVYFACGRAAIDAAAVFEGARDWWRNANVPRVLLVPDREYQHAIKDLEAFATLEVGSDVRVARVEAGNGPGARDCLASVGYHADLTDTTTLADYTVIVIGRATSPLLAHLALNLASQTVMFVDPRAASPTCVPAASCVPVSRTLARRYYLVQKAANCSVIGLLVGSLASSKTLPALQAVKNLIRASGKKHYTVSVGQLTEPKLANVGEIEIWCLFACPFTVLVDSRHLHRDIVTAWELSRALRGVEWDGQYSTETCASFDTHSTAQQAGADGSDPPLVFDSVTGKLRPRSALASLSSSTAMMPTLDSALTATSYARQHRTFRGLETREQRNQRLEQARVDSEAEGGTVQLQPRNPERAELESGLAGIASGYASERQRG